MVVQKVNHKVLLQVHKYSPIFRTSNVPARGVGTLFTGAQRPALVSATPGESTPKVMTTGKTTATPKITFFANC